MLAVTKGFARNMHIFHGSNNSYYSRNMAARRRGVKRSANKAMRAAWRTLTKTARICEEARDRLECFSSAPKGFATGMF
ncbi:MAG: hypothetical protein NTU97_01425 [Candidatus Magasanikbacteria bacterium]|nr:hypothetical protein [Candidatus Magasanikbacteria bacterium]